MVIRKINILIASFFILACNGNGNKMDNVSLDDTMEDSTENAISNDEVEEDEEEDAEEPLQTISVNKKEKKGIWTYSMKNEFPNDGNEYLLRNIREWMSECLGGKYLGDLADIDEVFNFYAKSFLSSQEAVSDLGYEAPECSSDHEFKLIWQNDNLVTYIYKTYWYGGGAHGSSAYEGQTFRKSDGKKFGKDMILHDADLQRELNKGLKKYFEVSSDTELEENLQISDIYSASYLPMPQTAPWIDKDGLHFIYGQYEIACYAAGMPEIVIPISNAKKFLTATILKEL